MNTGAFNTTKNQSIFCLPPIFRQNLYPDYDRDVLSDADNMEAWYAMKIPSYRIDTFYARINWFENGDPELPLSVENLIRQQPGYDWLRSEELSILAHKNRISLSRISDHVCLFPMHPDAEFNLASKVAIAYSNTYDFDVINVYLNDRGISHITEAMCRACSSYTLFFLLTRFIGFPVDEFQISLSLVKLNIPKLDDMLAFGYFMDTIYMKRDRLDSVQLENLENITSLFQTEGNTGVMKFLDTPYTGWARYGDEYLDGNIRFDVLEFTQVERQHVSRYFTDISDNALVSIFADEGLTLTETYIFRGIQKEGAASIYLAKIEDLLDDVVLPNVAH